MYQKSSGSKYHELTPEQRHFVDNKTINTTLSIKHWIAFLAKTSAYDKSRDEASKSLLGWIVAVSVMGTLFMFVFVNVLDLPVFLTAIAAIVALQVFLVRRRVSLGKRNLSNYLRNFFLPVLDALKEKAGEDAKMIAALDFRDPVRSLTPEKIEEPHLRRTTKLYSPKMIVAGVALKDQSYLEMVLLDEIRKMTITRRKTKFKTKTTHRLFIRLTVMKSVYQPGASTLPEGVEMEEQADRYVYKLRYKEKEEMIGILPPKTFMAQMGVLYGLFSAVPGATVPTFLSGMDVAQQTTLNNLFWSDQIFSQYDRDGFSRRSTGRLSSGGGESTFES